MREVTGAGLESDPQEVQRIISELAKKANRMDIVERLEKRKELEVSRYDQYTEAD